MIDDDVQAAHEPLNDALLFQWGENAKYDLGRRGVYREIHTRVLRLCCNLSDLRAHCDALRRELDDEKARCNKVVMDLNSAVAEAADFRAKWNRQADTIAKQDAELARLTEKLINAEGETSFLIGQRDGLKADLDHWLESDASNAEAFLTLKTDRDLWRDKANAFAQRLNVYEPMDAPHVAKWVQHNTTVRDEEGRFIAECDFDETVEGEYGEEGRSEQSLTFTPTFAARTIVSNHNRVMSAMVMEMPPEPEDGSVLPWVDYTQQLRKHCFALALNHQNGPCFYCSEQTNTHAGNPSRWPLWFPHKSEPGVAKAHHMGCVMRRLREEDDFVQRARQAWIDQCRRWIEHQRGCETCSNFTSMPHLIEQMKIDMKPCGDGKTLLEDCESLRTFYLAVKGVPDEANVPA